MRPMGIRVSCTHLLWTFVIFLYFKSIMQVIRLSRNDEFTCTFRDSTCIVAKEYTVDIPISYKDAQTLIFHMVAEYRQQILSFCRIAHCKSLTDSYGWRKIFDRRVIGR